MKCPKCKAEALYEDTAFPRYFRCSPCKARIYFHGPRATVQAPEGKTFVAFDADGIHLRIASYQSQDPFMLGALQKYDETKNVLYKPHIQNCSALFKTTPEEAVEWMKIESPKYTFSKNFIYMLLNGGDVPALKNAAISAGLVMVEAEVRTLLENFLAKASKFDVWRKGLLNEVKRTGSTTLYDGRRHRFWDVKRDAKSGLYKFGYDTVKEIYNSPLIGGEVSFMNPRFLAVWKLTQSEFKDWILMYHGHDGGMCEGPKDQVEAFLQRLKEILDPYEVIRPGLKMFVPFGFKRGDNWAYLQDL